MFINWREKFQHHNLLNPSPFPFQEAVSPFSVLCFHYPSSVVSIHFYFPSPFCLPEYNLQILGWLMVFVNNETSVPQVAGPPLPRVWKSFPSCTSAMCKNLDRIVKYTQNIYWI